MNYNEVRFGNWVKSGDHFFKIKGVNPDWAIFLHRGDDWCTDWMLIDPIPLTPEILEKAGFEKDGDYFFFQPMLENIHYRLIEFPEGNWIVSKGFINYNHELRVIKYLHQLQNLYFALTGEELEINL
jgi:hypothetical protein